jgi:hypothetical protein
MLAGQLIEFFPKLAVQDWFSGVIAPAHRAPSRQKLRNTAPDVLRISKPGDNSRPRQRRNPAITAVSSIRLFVVNPALPRNTRSLPPQWRMHAHPPGPGFPRQDPSAISLTSLIRIPPRCAFGDSPPAHSPARTGTDAWIRDARPILLLRGSRQMLCRDPLLEVVHPAGKRRNSRAPPERNTAFSCFPFLNAKRPGFCRQAVWCRYCPLLLTFQ